MRILHVIPQLALGGAEQVVLSLVREQRKQGLDAQLVVLGSQNAFPERLAGLPEPRFLHYGGRRRDVAGFVRCVRRLRRVIRDDRPDVVHSHLWPASRAVGWGLGGLRIPHVVHVHDTRGWLAGTDRRSRLLRAWTRWSLRGAGVGSHYLAVSDAVRRYTMEHLPGLTDAIEVCHNGIDMRPFGVARDERRKADAGRPIVVGTAGRFAPEKGHAHLIRAIAALRGEGIDVRLRIAGDGQLRGDYERLIAELGLHDAVELPGSVADMPAFYASLDGFALPSRGAEGLPITLLEAMASGLAIVASDVAGVREAIRDGVDGRLVPAADEGSLAAALRGLIEDAEGAAAMGEPARRRVADRFSVEAMTRQCIEVYGRVTASSVPAAAVTHAGS